MIRKLFKKKFVSTAFKFGKIEHRYGRLTGLMIFFSFISLYVHEYVYEYRYIPFLCIIVTFVCWLTYLVSHHFEKFCYGKGLRK